MSQILGQRIKELRLKKGLKQEELADMLGLTRPMIGNYENDKNEPSITDLLKLASLLETTGAYLIGEINYAGADAFEGFEEKLSFATSEYVPQEQFSKLEEKVDFLIDYVSGNTDRFKKESKEKITKKWDAFKAKVEETKKAGKQLGDDLRTSESS